MITIIVSIIIKHLIFTIKIAEFAHALFKQKGDTRGETVTSCASSQIVQSLTNWDERMPLAFSLSVTTVIFR